MSLSLARFRPEFHDSHDVLVVLEDSVDHLFVISPERLGDGMEEREVARTDTIEILPFALTPCQTFWSEFDYRVDQSGADDDPQVEIWLMSSEGSGLYNIVRRQGGVDTILNEELFAIQHAINILADCNAIDWLCVSDAARDVETVCVSNAMAILECFDESVLNVD